MNTSQTFKAAVLLALGIGCAAAATAVARTNAVSGHTSVAISSTTNAAGDAIPVVTVTAKRLTPTQKIVMAMQDRAAGHKSEPKRS